jgi:hypothetical protein
MTTILNSKRLFLLINLLGGSAVLGSYAWGLASRPEASSLLWGGTPQAIRPLYTVCMLLAAAGYFAFTPLIAFRLDPKAARVYRRLGYAAFNLLYAAILIPSALWLPLTLLAADRPGPGSLWLVRLDLAVVALGSLGGLGALLTLRPRPPRLAYRLAIAGCLAFCFQTVVLDAIVWSVYFH